MCNIAIHTTLTPLQANLSLYGLTNFSTPSVYSSPGVTNGHNHPHTLTPTDLFMNSMKLVIPLHLLYWSIHTKDESKRGSAFAFIFGVN